MILPTADTALIDERAWTADTPRQEAAVADVADPSAAVAVYVNHGRWIAECPICHGAQLACEGDRRFMCCECANEAIGGLWRPVAWPTEAAGIEAALVARPIEMNRNWIPGETVEDLLAETDRYLNPPPPPAEEQPADPPAEQPAMAPRRV